MEDLGEFAARIGRHEGGTVAGKGPPTDAASLLSRMPVDRATSSSGIDLKLALRQRTNWFQLGRFLLVGVIGYALNLATFAVQVHVLDMGYGLAAAISNLLALVHNFWWHRHWTFEARHGAADRQAVRFVAVSAGAFVFALVVLHVLVDVAGLPKVLSQALAVAATAPFNFASNKLWSFRH